MRATDASGSSAGESELSLTVSDEVELESVSLAFSEGESQDAMNETLPYPQALAAKSATLDPSQTLKVPPPWPCLLSSGDWHLVCSIAWALTICCLTCNILRCTVACHVLLPVLGCLTCRHVQYQVQCG